MSVSSLSVVDSKEMEGKLVGYALDNMDNAVKAIKFMETGDENLIARELKLIRCVSRQFARFLSHVKKNRYRIRELMINFRFNEKINQLAATFENYKKLSYSSFGINNPFIWLPFLYKDEDEKLSSITMPVIIDQFKLRSIIVEDKRILRAKWRGMSTCTCQKTSPRGWYNMADHITEKLNSLEDDAPISLFHLGSGGCLFDAVLLSRLARFKNIKLYLIDKCYDLCILGRYNSKEKSDRDKIPLGMKNSWMYDHNKSLQSLLKFAFDFLPNPISVEVFQSCEPLLRKREKSHTVLYLEDPEIYPKSEKHRHLSEALAESYERLAANLLRHSVSSHFYCLDEWDERLRLNGYISNRQALKFRAFMKFPGYFDFT